ncbi:MAG: HEPN domain-containing protein, partial [Anaerolineae bacterium]
RNWLIKAQHDLASARVLAASNPPLLDTAIYHCQQAAEKSLKGYLVYCDQAFERVHDIEVLIRLAMLRVETFVDWIDVGIELTPYARVYRYPGYATEPGQEQFDRAVTEAEGLYGFVLSMLPFETWPE